MRDSIKIQSKINGHCERYTVSASSGVSLAKQSIAIPLLLQLEDEAFDKIHAEIAKMIVDQSYKKPVVVAIHGS